MFAYLSIPIFIVFLWVISIRYGINKIAILRYGMLYLFVISTFRSISLGADSFNYIQAFRTISNRGTYYMEKGYVFLNRLVSSFTSNYSVLIFIVNCLFFLSVYYYIKHFVKEEYWVYCLIVIAFQPYIYLQTTFNIIRQCCAVSFALIGMGFFVNSVKFKHKFTGYILFDLMIIVGAQFHRSTYFLLAIPIIYIIKMNKTKWRLLALLFVGFNQVGLSRILSRIEGLVGNANYINYSASILNNPIYILLVLVYFFWITSYYDSLEIEKWERYYFNIYLFSIAFMLFAVSNDMVYRVYIILAIISLPGIQIVFQNDKSSRIVLSKKLNSSGIGIFSLGLCLYYICFFVGYILYLNMTHNSAYIPYHTIFWKG